MIRFDGMRNLATFLLLIGSMACGGSDDGNPGDMDGGKAQDGSTGTTDGGGDPADARLGPDAMPNVDMSFFVTSTGSGANGGDLGGLDGADAKCQNLATNGGAGARTWRAYLSTGATGPGPAVDARDRIGSGPWFNQQGTMVASSVAALHTDGILGNLMFDELGATIPGNEHDALTGSARNGTLNSDSETCDNWTNGTVNSQGQVGHTDTEVDDGESWNSQHSGSCDEESLNGNAGTGRIYCFAID